MTAYPRIAMFIPYFGKWPEWMSLYLYSCSRNPQIDFHFFTDCGLPNDTYSNTIFHPCTLRDYLDRVKMTTGLELPEKSYKLCDVRPFIGKIHEDMIESSNYEWWGFSDIDLVYGDLSDLLKHSCQAHIELITTHIKHIAGHFTLIKYKSDAFDSFQIDENIKALAEGDKSVWMDEVVYSEVVRPRRVRQIDRLWYSVGRKLKIDRNYFYQWCDKLIPGRRANAFYCEPCTTFPPFPNETYVLDMSDMTWTMGKGGFLECVKPNNKLPYLHFLMFKKGINNPTGRFWPSDFYQIPSDYHWRGNEKVEISLRHIKLL